MLSVDLLSSAQTSYGQLMEVSECYSGRPYFNPDLPDPIVQGSMVAGDHTPASLGVGKPLFFTNAHTELDRGVENVPRFVPVVIVPAANRRCSSFSPIKS